MFGLFGGGVGDEAFEEAGYDFPSMGAERGFGGVRGVLRYRCEALSWHFIPKRAPLQARGSDVLTKAGGPVTIYKVNIFAFMRFNVTDIQPRAGMPASDWFSQYVVVKSTIIAAGVDGMKKTDEIRAGYCV